MSERQRTNRPTSAERIVDAVRTGLDRLGEALGLVARPPQVAYAPARGGRSTGRRRRRPTRYRS